MTGTYDSIRTAVLSEGSDSRVEVNQRALIDKILARYASANAVYRELLQNSNDAEATISQILFTTTPSQNGSIVTQVVYRNNGLPFRPQDWSRLRKIAEGNPDVSKVGAFGVGAYTMFSICEEPMVLSGDGAMAFAWKGDSLWVKLAKVKPDPKKWTTFVLPSRDPYVLPDLKEFGGFLCSSLTFTACLKEIAVFVDGVHRVTIKKRDLHQPRIITPPKASSWWRGDGAVTNSPDRVFTLGRDDGAITETIVEMTAQMDGDSSTVCARYVSALANARVPADMARRMERVTKKKPPSQVKLEVFIDADSTKPTKQRKSPATAITDAFSPRMGAGRVFIGFKTSQTTGLAAHLAAPLLPTVEREAIDFQDPTLKVYNYELLAIAGILLRLTLEHSMGLVGEQWVKNEPQRKSFEERERKKQKGTNANPDGHKNGEKAEITPVQKEPKEDQTASSIFSFARFMSSGVKKIADVISSVDFNRDDEDDLLRPRDPRPLSREEKDAVLLMRSFSPQQSTPDARVGTTLARGFEICLPGLLPPVLTKSGVSRGADCRLPFQGIERFVKSNVVRAIILENAENYLLHVAGCQKLSLHDLASELRNGPIEEDDVVLLLKWWTKFARTDQSIVPNGVSLKENLSFIPKSEKPSQVDEGSTLPVLYLKNLRFYVEESTFPAELPMPNSVLPKSLRQKVPFRVLKDNALLSWFNPLSMEVWAKFICKHSCLTQGTKEESSVRLNVLSTLSREHGKRNAEAKTRLERILVQGLSRERCIPCEDTASTGNVTDFPKDLYLSSAELTIFDGLGSFNKVSPALAKEGVSDEFLIALGVRKTISMDFLFSQLDSLKWNRNPMPLISYLRAASLTAGDLEKLRTTQYLPEVQDKTRTYAPGELYLPSPELTNFPFVKILQWPSSNALHERSPDAEFLKSLGCQIDPPLQAVMNYLVTDVKDDEIRQRCLDFIYKRLISASPYLRSYTRFLDWKFLPAIRVDPLKPEEPKRELQSPSTCYSNNECKCMGFSILDTTHSKKYGRGRGYAEVFRCISDPPPESLIYQLLSITGNIKKECENKKSTPDASFNQQVFKVADDIFKYMSSRSQELDKPTIETLARSSFIPCEENLCISWYRPNQIYFENNNRDASGIFANLFLVTKFSPFLAAVGVKGEPSNEDLFRLLVSSPQEVLEKLGEESKYRSLLRRIAANPPYSKITAKMKKSAFLLAYRESDRNRNEESGDDTLSTPIYTLAKAEDICVIDNSHFSRLFNSLSAPQESDLERFYISLGSKYISKRVHQQFFAVGGKCSDTALTEQFRSRIQERRPLLISSIISRAVLPKAALLLSDEKLEIFEVRKVKALYTLENIVKTEFVTCSAQNIGSRKLSVYITQELDWFHVGNAIGSEILVRCNVQDAFFIGSLLEAPLSQLRARGFPVDRILQAAAPVVAASPPKTSPPKLANTVAGAPGTATAPPPKGKDGFVDILQQMFPDCREEHIRQLLGSNASLESLRSVADQLADGKYPKKGVQKSTPIPKPTSSTKPEAGSTSASAGSSGSSSYTATRRKRNQPKKSQSPNVPSEEVKRPESKKSGILGRAFRGLRGVTPPGLSGVAGVNSGVSVVPPGLQPSRAEAANTRPNDAATQSGLVNVLRDSVKSSRPAADYGVSAPERKVISVPESLERDAASCEVIHAHELGPFSGPHRTGKTSMGLRVFSSLKSSDNEAFLSKKWQVVESFASVLARLCLVYSLQLETVSIFYEVTGRTIAFNCNRALYFNLRYFANLHYTEGRAAAPECYAYWFTIMAHELSHNMVSAHGKQHGFYTESYVSQYMPKLLEMISDDWRT